MLAQRQAELTALRTEIDRYQARLDGGEAAAQKSIDWLLRRIKSAGGELSQAELDRLASLDQQE
jgi:hypothetical protein